MKKDLLKLSDWSKQEIGNVLDLAAKVKASPQDYSNALEQKTLAMLFQKDSTRTRTSFEAGMTQLGGHAIFLDWRSTHFHSVNLLDEVKCIERYADLLMARVFKHETVQEIAQAAAIPVINGLCNSWHPCQILGDLLTIREKKGSLKGLKLAFVGDGCNTCNSLIAGGTKAGLQVAVATPPAFKPSAEAEKEGEKSGNYSWHATASEAVQGADLVYTDTWVSMGTEQEKKQRLLSFPPFQVNASLMEKAKQDALFMHCLPAHRNQEVTDAVLDSAQSIVFDQAENRLHAQKAIMLKLMEKC